MGHEEHDTLAPVEKHQHALVSNAGPEVGGGDPTSVEGPLTRGALVLLTPASAKGHERMRGA